MLDVQQEDPLAAKKKTEENRSGTVWGDKEYDKKGYVRININRVKIEVAEALDRLCSKMKEPRKGEVVSRLILEADKRASRSKAKG